MACACLAVLVTSVWCWGQVGDRPTTAVAQRKTLLRQTGIPTRSRQTTVHLQPLLTKTRQTCPSPQGQVSGRTSLVHQLLTPVFNFLIYFFRFIGYFRRCRSILSFVILHFTVHFFAYIRRLLGLAAGAYCPSSVCLLTKFTSNKTNYIALGSMEKYINVHALLNYDSSQWKSQRWRCLRLTLRNVSSG